MRRLGLWSIPIVGVSGIAWTIYEHRHPGAPKEEYWTLDQVRERTHCEGRVYVTYRDGVYDVTEYIDQ